MADGSAAEAAYQRALEEIERVKAEGGTGVTLCHGPFADLARIPPEVAGIEGLKSIQLQGTQVSDLSVLSELTTLKEIILSKTKASDISPLKNLTELQYLDLSGTAVAGISPLRNLLNLSTLNLQGTNVSDISALRDHQSLYRLSFKGTKIADISILQGKASFGRLDLDGTLVSDLRPLVAAYANSMRNFYLLSYRDTPAWAQDAELARIANEAEREDKLTRWAIAYLKTLPPWPEPLPWLADGLGPPTRREPSLQGEPLPPAIALPTGLRRINLAEARLVLESNAPQLRARCQHVVAELDDALAIQAVRIPNEPDQLAAHTAITNSLTLAKAALMGLHDTLPEDNLDRPVTESEVTALRTAFDALLDKLKSAAAYVDRTDHTPTYGGLLKLGCATGIASVLCLFPGLAMTAAIPGVYAMLYGGPAAIKTLGEFGKKAGGA